MNPFALTMKGWFSEGEKYQKKNKRGLSRPEVKTDVMGNRGSGRCSQLARSRNCGVSIT